MNGLFFLQFVPDAPCGPVVLLQLLGGSVAINLDGFYMMASTFDEARALIRKWEMQQEQPIVADDAQGALAEFERMLDKFNQEERDKI